jgi:hypothetical protein
LAGEVEISSDELVAAPANLTQALRHCERALNANGDGQDFKNEASRIKALLGQPDPS